MMLGERLRTWAVGTADSATMPQVACVDAGHALLLHVEGHLNPRALAFARMILHHGEHGSRQDEKLCRCHSGQR